MKTNLTKHFVTSTLSKWGQQCLLATALLLSTASLHARAQAPAIEWDKTFGGNGTDDLSIVRQTKDGGYMLGGNSNSGISGDKTEGSENYEYWIIKVNAVGNKEWDHSFQVQGSLTSLVETADGGYMVGGSSSAGINDDKSEPSYGESDYWILKLDAAGNKEWDRTFGGEGSDVLTSLKQTKDGGYILGGESNSEISGDKSEMPRGNKIGTDDDYMRDYWVLKVDAAGNKEWERTLGGRYEDWLTSIEQTTDGGYMVGGTSDSDNGDRTDGTRGLLDFWIVKLDAKGVKQWDRGYGGSGGDELKAMQQTIDGGYILGGFSWSPKSADRTAPLKGNRDYWLVKIDAAGNKEWDRAYGGELQSNSLSALQQTAEGGYILGGNGDAAAGISGDKTETSRGEQDYWIVKVDTKGNKQWDRTLGGSDYDWLTSLQQATDGGFILGGTSWSGRSGDKTESLSGRSDYWVVKLKGEATAVKPEIAAFTPGSGLPGAIVTLTGKHLLSTTGITLNGVRAGFKIINDCELKIAVPVAATTGKIKITTATGSVLSAKDFIVLQPIIAKITPPVGAVGARFAIRGNHLASTKQIFVNGVAVSEFTIVDNTLIRAVVPAGATSGKVTLVLKGGAKAQSSESFRLLTTGADKVAETKKLAAYPNPFVAGVTLPVNLDNAGSVSVLIYNTKGQQVKALNFTNLQAGEHQLEWDGKDGQNRPVIEGLYFYKLNVNGKLAAGQLLKSGK